MIKSEALKDHIAGTSEFRTISPPDKFIPWKIDSPDNYPFLSKLKWSMTPSQ